MAFSGYLVKVGSYTIPLDFMKVESYKSAPDQRQDLDSYRDANGYLHRNVLPHTATKIEFETPYMSRRDFQLLIQGIRSNFTSNIERRCNVTYYDEETDSYKTGTFYMPGTMEYQMFNKNIYAPSRFAFIEY
jgi:hypothetical protein